MKLVYTVEIDDEIYSLDGLLELLNETVNSTTDCMVLKSRIESSDEICETGDWEDD
ncbi:hypothetical protein [Clostridium sp. KNHs205]|uniref:hypothetical protein n=1 Tax=Clostridium sp. KNHs205 TaxID=1449050 RepID=UPI000A424109|nr:hypothetical protein [Clostridium sp. KNHs205]